MSSTPIPDQHSCYGQNQPRSDHPVNRRVADGGSNMETAQEHPEHNRSEACQRHLRCILVGFLVTRYPWFAYIPFPIRFVGRPSIPAITNYECSKEYATRAARPGDQRE